MPVPEDKANHIEQYAPKLLLHLMGLPQVAPGPTQLSPAEVAQYTEWWHQDQAGDLFQRLAGPGSFNQPQMLQAVGVWMPGTSPVQLFAWWQSYCEWQLGESPPPAGKAQLGFLDGNEPWSPTYGPYRWGSLLAVRAKAKQLGESSILDLTSAWVTAQAAQAALLAVPWPDEVRQRSQSGQLFDDALFVSPVGERGTYSHAVSEVGQLFCQAVGQGFTSRRAYDWPMVVARALSDRFGCSLGVDPTVQQTLRSFVQQPNAAGFAAIQKILQPATFWAEQHVLRWPTGRLVYKPTRQNSNSPCFFYDWYAFTPKTASLGYPWPQARDFGIKEPGQCTIETVGGQQEVVASGDPSSSPVQQNLPAGPPLSHWVMGPQGLQVAAGG